MLRDGPILAAVDECKITVNGYGGHGAEPQDAADPIVAGASIIMALQTVVSRNIHPQLSAVVTVGAFHAGAASNVIPETAEMLLTIRSFDPGVRDELEKRIRAIAEGQAASYGMSVTIDYERGYNATVNHRAETDYVADLARRFAGPERSQKCSAHRWARKTLPTCWRNGRAVISSSAPHEPTTTRRCTIQNLISTTKSCQSEPLSGSILRKIT